MTTDTKICLWVVGIFIVVSCIAGLAVAIVAYAVSFGAALWDQRSEEREQRTRQAILDSQNMYGRW